MFNSNKLFNSNFKRNYILGITMVEPYQELSACYAYPDTYNLEFDSSSLNEILHIFTSEILQGCSFSEVESCLVEYITSIIEPVGWNAVWRSTKRSCPFGSQHDFIVEVVNVSLQKIEADVLIKSVILTKDNKYTLNNLKREINIEDVITVPLIELYTMSEDDEEELYAKTATAIEYVRFFMTHLSRPWDGENEEFMYSEKILKPRLQLYFDIQNSTLPKRMITKIKYILKQGWSILNEMHMLYSEMNASDSEAEISGDDVLQAMSLRAKLNELQAKMEILENPLIRSFMMKKYIPHKSAKSQEKSGPVTYIVSKEFTYQMISNLPVDSSTVLEFEHNAEAAFKMSSSGDKIIIFPGVYECDTLGWLDGEVRVEGIGTRSDIVLEATGNSDVFLNCISPNLSLENVCLKAKKGLLSAVVVHRGKVHLNNCLINSNEASLGILLLGGSIAFIEDSTICNSSEDGIQMRCLSSLNLISSDINHCQRHGIQIDAEATNSTESHTEINITKSFILDNAGHGIHLNNVPLSNISLQKPAGDFSVLKLFHWLKSTIEDSDIENNKETSIGFSSMCKINKTESSNAVEMPPSCSNQEDLNCSAISDVLNEISFTDLNVSKYDHSD